VTRTIRSSSPGTASRTDSAHCPGNATFGFGSLDRVPQPTPLGEFLRARHAVVRPVERDGKMRLVRGLRREEVAKLAAISPDYYVRLEQGRNDSPSPQVVDALARALRLDEDGARYLHKLAGHAPTAVAGAGPQQVPDGIGLLVQGLREVPAFVHASTWTSWPPTRSPRRSFPANASG
jgi:transcriptional regulator with XRE-family HTH domain